MRFRGFAWKMGYFGLYSVEDYKILRTNHARPIFVEEKPSIFKKNAFSKSCRWLKINGGCFYAIFAIFLSFLRYGHKTTTTVNVVKNEK